MRLHKLQNKFYGLVILTCILTIAVFLFNAKVLKVTSVTLILIFFLFLVGKLIKKYIHWFTQHMFNKKITGYNKKIEKPRMLFYLVFGLLLILVLILYRSLSLEAKIILGYDVSLVGFVVLNILSATSIFFIWNTWNVQFEKIIIPAVQSNLDEEFPPNFKSDKNELDKIYESAFRNKQITNSKKEFFAFISGDKKAKINWIDKTVKSKQISNITLLDFLEEISDTTIDGFAGQKRKALITFITNNFLKNGEIPNKRGMNNTYSTWFPNKNRQKIRKKIKR